MSAHEVEFRCKVRVTINNPYVVTRITDHEGDEWRSQFYKLRTEADVLEHLAFNFLANGSTDLSGLDGWADLPKDAATMELVRGSVEAER